jgi:hypothetical protein
MVREAVNIKNDLEKKKPNAMNVRERKQQQD